MNPSKLIFVYAGESGTVNALIHAAHKVVSPGTYPCKLCGLMNNVMTQKAEWIHFMKKLEVPTEFLHSDEFKVRHPQLRPELPAIFAEQAGTMEVLVSANEIGSCKSTTELIQTIEAKQTMNPSFETPITDPPDLARNAKGALERVCSGAGLDPSSKYYASTFVDHVNDLEFYGLVGTQQSVELYTKVLSNIEITVAEQIVEGDRVTSRFVVAGTNLGRRVRFHGITISRFERGLIVEDWSVTDTLGMLRQLGLWRSLLVGLRQRKSLKTAAMKSSSPLRNSP